jgi:hypothetical protein
LNKYLLGQIHKLANLLSDDEIAVLNMDAIYRQLSLPLAELHQMKRSYVSDGHPYEFFAIMLSKWYASIGSKATVGYLVTQLKGMPVMSTATCPGWASVFY